MLQCQFCLKKNPSAISGDRKSRNDFINAKYSTSYTSYYCWAQCLQECPVSVVCPPSVSIRPQEILLFAYYKCKCKQIKTQYFSVCQTEADKNTLQWHTSCSYRLNYMTFSPWWTQRTLSGFLGLTHINSFLINILLLWQIDCEGL